MIFPHLLLLKSSIYIDKKCVNEFICWCVVLKNGINFGVMFEELDLVDEGDH
jgi:hypothetical protein